MYLKCFISCQSGQLPKLQLDTGDFSHRAVRGPTWWMGGSFPNVHVRVRHLGWGVESWQQACANVFLKLHRRWIIMRMCEEVWIINILRLFAHSEMLSINLHLFRTHLKPIFHIYLQSPESGKSHQKWIACKVSKHFWGLFSQSLLNRFNPTCQ